MPSDRDHAYSADDDEATKDNGILCQWIYAQING